MFLLGTISAGVAYNKKLSVSFAAREGARYGATHDTTDPQWAQTVAKFVRERASGDSTDVCVSLVSGAATSQTVYRGTASYSTRIGPNSCISDTETLTEATRVQVTVTTQSQIEAIFFTFPVTLKSHAVAKFEE